MQLKDITNKLDHYMFCTVLVKKVVAFNYYWYIGKIEPIDIDKPLDDINNTSLVFDETIIKATESRHDLQVFFL